MATIKLDDDFRIELGATYDLVEHKGFTKDKKTGNEVEIKRDHGYHSSLEKALYRYSKIILQRTGKEFTISEYINELDRIYNSIKENTKQN